MDTPLVPNVLSICYLIGLSVSDLKYKKINRAAAYIFVILGAICMFIFRPGDNLVLSILVGAAVLLLSALSREAVGYGDGLILMGIGLFLGWRVALYSLTIGILLSSPVSLIYMAKNKHKGPDVKKEIPFVPFLLMGLILGQLYG